MTKKQQKHFIHNLVIITEAAITFLVLFLGFTVYANWSAFSNEVTYALKSATPASPTPTATPSATPEPIVEPAHIVINTISADVPITWDVPAEQTVDALNHGVAHMAGTARPGQTGNTFITGHSSDFVWKHNPYAAAFSLLPKLKSGDPIEIRENGQVYGYKVTATQVVAPTAVEVTNPTTTPTLTLMTCYPVGTTRDRYIVRADLISSPQPVTTVQHSDFTVPTIKFR